MCTAQFTTELRFAYLIAEAIRIKSVQKLASNNTSTPKILQNGLVLCQSIGIHSKIPLIIKLCGIDIDADNSDVTFSDTSS